MDEYIIMSNHVHGIIIIHDVGNIDGKIVVERIYAFTTDPIKYVHNKSHSDEIIQKHELWAKNQ